MQMRRFTRLTNAFSMKFENHMYMVAFYTVRYNFIRIHKTLCATPAMEAGLSETAWDMEDLVRIMDERARSPARAVPTKVAIQTDALPKSWVIKIGSRLVRHCCYAAFRMVEVAPRPKFAGRN